MKTYNIRLKKYDIGTYMFRELSAFCRQYDDKKHMAAWLREKDQEIAQQYQADCDMVDGAAKEASEDMYEYILRNVIKGVPFSCLNAPCGKNQFSEMRRKFFYILAKKRGMI